MSYLHTPEGKAASQDALKIMDDSKRIEDLIETMRKNRKQMQKVIPYLPEWLRADILSDHFTVECLQFFKDLDKDGNGTLEPEELFPMVLALSNNAHEMSLDVAQCRKFTAIFDDEKTGVISKNEFVNFSRFLIVMGWLDSQEGKVVLDRIKKDEKKRAQDAKKKKKEPPALDNGSYNAPCPGPHGPTSPAHLALDIDFYKKKSERLTDENDALRDKVSMMERTIRRLESKLEEQEMKYKHACVDLNAAAGYR